jgi:hypothetical protein
MFGVTGLYLIEYETKLCFIRYLHEMGKMSILSKVCVCWHVSPRAVHVLNVCSSLNMAMVFIRNM